jgi:ubiquinone/menaquinone biosynthesis C-methylase UbiE
MQTKHQREQAFHDDAFTADIRRTAWKYYSVAKRSRAAFEATVSKLAAGRRVLDFGCGRGANTLLLAGCSAHVTSIDVSHVAVRKARDRTRAAGTPSVSFTVMDAERLGLRSASYDLVCGKAVLHHLDLHHALHEIARVLAPGGSAVFLEPLAHNPLIRLYRTLTPRFRTADEHPFRFDDLAIAPTYFGHVCFQYMTLLPLAVVPFRGWRGFDRVVRALTGADAVLFRLLPFTRRYAWQVLILLSQPKHT